MQHDDIGTERTIVSNATFETFLDRLAKQLRTSPQVGNQIIDELQDHYEDRLADLLSDGWERGAAEERALKEFGEATQLANNFRSVFRNRRRRMAMRMTAGTIALATLVGMVLMFGGPDQEPGKAVAQKKGNSPPPARAGGGAVIRANSGGTRKKAPTAAKRKTLTIEENNAITEQNLARRIEAEFIDMPLDDMLEYIGSANKIQFYVSLTVEETKKLKPVTINLKKVRADMALELALQQAGKLAYAVRDGIVIISTDKEMEKATEVRIYNCRDLLRWTPTALRTTRPKRRGFGSDMYGGTPSAAAGAGAGAGFGARGGGAAGAGAGADGGAGAGGAGGRAGGAGGGGAGGGGAGGRGGAGGGRMGGGRMGDGEMGGMGNGGSSTSRQRRAKKNSESLARLEEVLFNAVEPRTWAEFGGYGTLAEFDGLLIINHNVQAHRKIERVLAMLRKALSEATTGKAARAPAKGQFVPRRRR